MAWPARESVGAAGSFLNAANASRSKFHLNDVTEANNQKRMPKRFKTGPMSTVFRQNALNAGNYAVTVAPILVIIVIDKIAGASATADDSE